MTKKEIITEGIKELDNIWYTQSGYQNENLPLAYDDIVALLKAKLSQAYEAGKREERKFIGKNKRCWYNKGFNDGFENRKERDKNTKSVD
ncbi:MAG: hypothetical protein PHE73_09245 [Sulfurovaceae bacterium]|nr:hypothetical protein [Sulfurovaceae bacterium]